MCYRDLGVFAERRLPTDVVSSIRPIALAACDASGLTTPPPVWLEKEVQELAPAMPPDLSLRLLAVPFFRWLRVASAMDFSGDLRGARLLLDRLETAGPTRLPPEFARELSAIVCARRGRLARQIGEVEAAVDWYQEGLARSEGRRDQDAWGSCVQGLANAAQARGDARTGERLARLVTLQRGVVPSYARVAAWLTRAVIHRQQGRLELATRCAWQAHDLVDEWDERRAMALVELSRLAFSRGQTVAARRGFEVVLGFAQTLRVRRPARSGLLAMAFAHWRAAPTDSEARVCVRQAADALLADVARALDPWQRLHAQLDALEAYLALAHRRETHGVRSRRTREERARTDALEESVAGQLATLARRGGSWRWAEERLAALVRKRGCCATRSAAAAWTGATDDTDGYARLAALPIPSRFIGVRIGE